MTRSAGDLWCLPTAQAWATYGRPKVLVARLRKLSLLPPHEGGAGQFLLKPPRAPCKGLLCRQAVPSWDLSPALGQGARHLLLCALGRQPVVWNRALPLLKKVLLGTSSACHGGPKPWMFWVRWCLGLGKEWPTAGSRCLPRCLMMGDPPDGDKQEGRGAMCFRLHHQRPWEAVASPSGPHSGRHPVPRVRPPHQDVTLGTTAMGVRGSRK